MRKEDQAETEQDVPRKWQKKERERKVEHEQRKEPVEKATGEGEGNRVAVDTELPITPSIEIPEAMTGSPIDIEEIGEPSRRQEEDINQRPYASDWTIYPGTQLTRPLVRAEWVAQALSPAEIATYSGAYMFDIYDIANRATVLVKALSFFKMRQGCYDREWWWRTACRRYCARRTTR